MRPKAKRENSRAERESLVKRRTEYDLTIVIRTPGVSSMRALGVRSSDEGRTVDA